MNKDLEIKKQYTIIYNTAEKEKFSLFLIVSDLAKNKK